MKCFMYTFIMDSINTNANSEVTVSSNILTICILSSDRECTPIPSSKSTKPMSRLQCEDLDCGAP